MAAQSILNSVRSSVHVVPPNPSYPSVLLLDPISMQYVVPFLINLSGSVLFISTLAESKLSLAVPIANASTFVFTALSGALLGEKLNPLYTILGVALVVTGVVLCQVWYSIWRKVYGEDFCLTLWYIFTSIYQMRVWGGEWIRRYRRFVVLVDVFSCVWTRHETSPFPPPKVATLSWCVRSLINLSSQIAVILTKVVSIRFVRVRWLLHITTPWSDQKYAKPEMINPRPEIWWLEVRYDYTWVIRIIWTSNFWRSRF